MNGGEIIGQVLKKQGVKFLFTLCGGHISPILVGAKKQEIRIIDVRHEATAIFAADAMARLTGIPGIAAVTAGPGVTNSITAIKNAQMAQSPMILLGGAAATVLKGRGALQDIEQIKLYKTLTKWSVSIKQDCDIVSILEEAFDVAKSGIPGPVFIECPIDLLYDEKLVREWYVAKSAVSKNIVERAVKWYLRKHVDHLFACSSKPIKLNESEEIIPFSVQKSDLIKVSDHINVAKNPVIILGSQSMLRVQDIERLRFAIESLGIPAYLTGMARGLLKFDNSLSLRHNRRMTLKKADLVILAGMPMDFRLNYGRDINRRAALITINRSKKEVKKNRKPTLGIQADPSVFLQELANYFHNGKKLWNKWLEQSNEKEKEREHEILQFSKIKTEYINPLLLCFKINEIIDDNSIIIGDGGDFVATASYIIKPKNPLSWLDPGPFGTLGVGAGFALAAKLVHPNSEVWLLYGDGAAGYSIAEFDTFVRHKVPIIAVVGNDAGWTQIARDQIEYLKDDVGTILNYNDYHIVAKGYGAEGIILKNSEDISDGLQHAKSLAKNGRPVLINALIGKTDFRKGSISM
jgi:acetolactate synthase-like protein